MNPTLAELPASEQEIVSVDPATLRELGRTSNASTADIQNALAQARKAQPLWAARTFKERAAFILRARDLLVERQDELSELISREVGKPVLEALVAEVLSVTNLMDYFARTSAKILKPEQFTLSVFRNKKSRIQFSALGVVAIISPWNYPFSIPTGHVVMALMAGNAVLLKPSEFATLTGLQIGRLFRDAGLPDGLLQILPGSGRTGAALVNAAVDKVFFTGSVRTGRAVAQIAVSRFLPCVLELGGKDAMIVCADAPLERTVNGAIWGAFNNCGQACASVERLFVVENIANEFIGELLTKMRSLRTNDKGDGDIGPVTHARQLEIVSAHVNEAVAEGAKVLIGGKRNETLPGYFYEPTVLINVKPSMRIMREETFGPVLPIMTVSNEAEAIREANNSNYGLLASVWTRDTNRGKEIAAQLEAGTVIINDVMYTHAAAETPWFGVKESGAGITHSKHGLREFVRMKHINWDLLPLRSNLWWFPYSEKKRRIIQRLITVLHRWGFKKWV